MLINDYQIKHTEDKIMKKAIIAIVVIAIAAAAAVGIYFAIGNNNSNEATAELLVTKDSIDERITLLEALIKNPDRYKKHLAENFGLGEEKAEEFYAAPENWLSFEQILVIENIGDKNYTVYGYDVKENGKNGIYINTSAGGEIGIAPGSSATVSLSILCSDIELSSDEVKALVDEMEVSVVYTNSPTEYADGTASVEETKTAAIVKESK